MVCRVGRVVRVQFDNRRRSLIAAHGQRVQPLAAARFPASPETLESRFYLRGPRLGHPGQIHMASPRDLSVPESAAPDASKSGALSPQSSVGMTPLLILLAAMFEKSLSLAAIAWAGLFLLQEFDPHSQLLGPALLICILISVVAAVRRLLVRRASQSWPSVLGSVEFTSVLDNRGRSKLIYPYVLHIAYSYVAAGERYSGFHEQRYRSEADADALAGGLKGRGLMVRYNPGRPDQSVAELMSSAPDAQAHSYR